MLYMYTLLEQFFPEREAGIILGQNCIRLLDAALNKFFQKIVLSKAV